MANIQHDAPLWWNPCAFPHIHCIFLARIESSAYILPLMISVYLRSNFSGGRRKTFLFLKEGRFRRSRSSKITDIGTNRKRVCDFLLVRHSNLGPILRRFRDSLLQVLRVLRSLMVGSVRVETLSYNEPWNYFRSRPIPTCVKTIPERHRQADRQTDRRMGGILWHTTSYCFIVFF